MKKEAGNAGYQYLVPGTSCTSTIAATISTTTTTVSTTTTTTAVSSTATTSPEVSVTAEVTSRVGDSISARGQAVLDPLCLWGGLRSLDFNIPLMIGKQKAAVFPDPVCAQAMRSRPAMEIGMACRCTGVGFTYLHLRMFSFTASPKSISAKVLAGGGTNILVGIKVDARVLQSLEINLCGLCIFKRVWFTVSTVPPRAGVPTTTATPTISTTTLAGTNYGAATTTTCRASPTRATTNNSCVPRRLHSSRPNVSYRRSCGRHCLATE
ncbi:hypothetical protein U9M48_010885, partial [Paspalum notatum var. saurae]